MQLTLIKTLFIIGTLAGVALANNGGHKAKGGYHHKGGVIKKTILIDGCTGKPLPPPTPYDDVSAIVAPPAVPAGHDLLNDLNGIFDDLESDAVDGTVDENVDDFADDLF
ncbi:hypothetical protein BC941DRAFT_444864 [Chlamydoabsidia padenii]|nr:hypothetical protein BC941DRAFT_444864 [Chlamydoabsidia padenii]